MLLINLQRVPCKTYAEKWRIRKARMIQPSECVVGASDNQISDERSSNLPSVDVMVILPLN